MATYTRENVTKALEDAVALKGEDYVYPGSSHQQCYYSVQDEDLGTVPSCIVGHVIAVLDPEGFEKVAAFESCTGDSKSARAVLDYGSLEGVKTIQDDGLVYALTCAQSVQDNGRTWGEALNSFRSALDKHPVAE